ncbi:MAG: hypothetical protein P1U41_09505 [Vicingaceae bacterium]|nr:hypothetical protein [Vicingaceae bacterium]
MILLHIISDEEEQALEIVDILMEQNLLLEAVLLEKVTVRKKTKEGNPISISQTLIMGKTKALLFTSIDELLKVRYKEKMPVIYSTPIVHMDWEQSKELVNEVAKI